MCIPNLDVRSAAPGALPSASASLVIGGQLPHDIRFGEFSGSETFSANTDLPPAVVPNSTDFQLLLI